MTIEPRVGGRTGNGREGRRSEADTARGPAGAALVDAALVDAARAGARLSKAIEVALTDVGLSLPQYRLLAFLAGGPERASALADWLSVSPPSLTALVDGCVSRGLVERVAVEGDRRCVHHVLTEAGELALSEGDATVTEMLQDIFVHLSPAQVRKAVEGLALVAEALDAANARPATTGATR